MVINYSLGVLEDYLIDFKVFEGQLSFTASHKKVGKIPLVDLEMSFCYSEIAIE